jgi:ABC-2 type transport system ATP-binding protein
MILAQGLTKSYGPHVAVRDLTFHVSTREIVGFLGPNGAGKTTTMRILAGFLAPTTGRAQVAGFDILDHSIEVRRRVGYLPETVPLYPEMSVRQYLSYMGRLRHLPDLAGQIEAVIEEVGLGARADSFIGSLSKGLRQRVGLAQALIHAPEVLILDEPTIGLDPAQIIEVRSLIQSLGRERTILLSTHILSEAQQVCDRVLIINRGSIVAEDTPAHLQAQITGGERLRLKTSGEAQEVIRMALAIAGVTAAAQVNQTDEIEVVGAAGGRLGPSLARGVMDSGWDLLALYPVGASLEDVFLQLTREQIESPEEGS